MLSEKKLLYASYAVAIWGQRSQQGTFVFNIFYPICHCDQPDLLDIWEINILPVFHFQWHGSSRLGINGHFKPCTMLLSWGWMIVSCWSMPRLLLVSPHESNRPMEYEGHLELGTNLCFSLILIIKFWFTTWEWDSQCTSKATTVRKVIYVIEGSRVAAIPTKTSLISKGWRCML